ncbi:MAG: biopolymer transporter ExbD [Deltaproteobacteria bacterium]|nr:biopolymer transporter ExbD [Deltaproteobacteria bacterium]
MSFREEGGFRPRRPPVILDITPLIDCIFQLLIFFLLTASFVATPNVGVELPKSSATATSSPERDVVVVVTREGAIQFDGKTVSASDLVGALKKSFAQRPGARVLIQADRLSYHGQVVKVMDAAKAVGYKRLGVATQAGQ